MRISRKKFLGSGAAAIGAMLLLGLACVDRLDYQPAPRAPYHAETMNRLRSSAGARPVVRGELEAGFGRVKLTPKLNASRDDPARGEFRSVPLAGFGGRKGKPAAGVHEDLFVKAVALRVRGQLGILVSMDALIVPRDAAETAAARLNEQWGLRREQLYFGATHTHCGLGGWGEGIAGEAFAGDFNPAVARWFANCIITAACQAIDDLKPAEFGSGQFSAPEFVQNRLVGTLGTVDDEFSFLLFRQRAGRACVVGSYSAHATVLSGRVMEFSGDYPGFWQRAVEQATGGIALFFAGGVASHGPAPGADGFAGADKMGRALAGRVLARLDGLSLTNVLTFGSQGLEVTLPAPQVRLTRSLRMRPWLGRTLLPLPARAFVQALRLDRSIWLSTPCDYSGELALELKDFYRAGGWNAVVTSFNGDYIGYVIPARYYHLSGYEPRLMSLYGPNLPDYLSGVLRELPASLARRMP